jgi:flavin reductase (DIM6/NTAB) family NADH-FMN oxidoreductase RutF
MRRLKQERIFTLLEPGPVVLVTTHDRGIDNVMTISWTMVMDFTPVFAITTGPWNHSWQALRRTRECVLAIPGADLLDTAVGIGTCSGIDTDKFAHFGLTKAASRDVAAPRVADCLANIECRVTDIIARHNIVVLEALGAWVDTSRRERRTLHAVGDGTFVADGRRYDRRRRMAAKLPPGA